MVQLDLSFGPMEWEEKEAIKTEYSQGKEYFLFVGGIQPRKNLMNLLKAFSLFKKWQRSNMKLLVAGRFAWQYEGLMEKLKTYKYRDDVVMLNWVSEEQLVKKIMGSAYALVYPSYFEGFGLPILEAMQAAVPVITSNGSSMPETAGDAAIFAQYHPQTPDRHAHLVQIFGVSCMQRTVQILLQMQQTGPYQCLQHRCHAVLSAQFGCLSLDRRRNVAGQQTETLLRLADAFQFERYDIQRQSQRKRKSAQAKSSRPSPESIAEVPAVDPASIRRVLPASLPEAIS